MEHAEEINSSSMEVTNQVLECIREEGLTLRGLYDKLQHELSLVQLQNVLTQLLSSGAITEQDSRFWACSVPKILAPNIEKISLNSNCTEIDSPQSVLSSSNTKLATSRTKSQAILSN